MVRRRPGNVLQSTMPSMATYNPEIKNDILDFHHLVLGRD
jgi:hypothetical protein